MGYRHVIRKLKHRLKVNLEGFKKSDESGYNSPGTLHEVPQRGQKRVCHAQQLARFSDSPGTCAA